MGSPLLAPPLPSSPLPGGIALNFQVLKPGPGGGGGADSREAPRGLRLHSRPHPRSEALKALSKGVRTQSRGKTPQGVRWTPGCASSAPPSSHPPVASPGPRVRASGVREGRGGESGGWQRGEPTPPLLPPNPAPRDSAGGGGGVLAAPAERGGAPNSPARGRWPRLAGPRTRRGLGAKARGARTRAQPRSGGSGSAVGLIHRRQRRRETAQLAAAPPYSS